jgi:hypothetical protein
MHQIQNSDDPCLRRNLIYLYKIYSKSTNTIAKVINSNIPISTHPLGPIRTAAAPLVPASLLPLPDVLPLPEALLLPEALPLPEAVPFVVRLLGEPSLRAQVSTPDAGPLQEQVRPPEVFAGLEPGHAPTDSYLPAHVSVLSIIVREN